MIERFEARIGSQILFELRTSAVIHFELRSLQRQLQGTLNCRQTVKVFTRSPSLLVVAGILLLVFSLDAL